MTLCLCKLGLNMSLLFQPLMIKAKKDGDQTNNFLSDFLLNKCSSPRSSNGYYQWSVLLVHVRNASLSRQGYWHAKNHKKS